MDIRSFRHKRKAEVNIVPMVDVLTVLIFFFLLTMQFKEIYTVNITPPSMKSSDQTIKDKPLDIAVSAKGEYFLGGEAIVLKDLGEELKKVAEKNPDVTLVLVADKDSLFESVTNVVDLIKLAKIKKLSIQTTKVD